ncbi:hypothetical protein [Methanobrevibacter sp.]|uniref:hypothetical protein n=1 Tax=Methanobrevibacter sp. TaxID=66852 RepID=UPI00386B9053
MLDYYEVSIIPNLLKNFKVKKAIISGLQDEHLVNEILKYDADFLKISDETLQKVNTPKNNPLKNLQGYSNYGAIFLNDDPNWYTSYNELNIIKKNNKEFPLVFICNNKFPHKRRDSYQNPESIPKKFLQEYEDTLPILYENEELTIKDGYFHACKENTPKNGVLTAIEDFIKENPNIGIMDIKFLEEITILYPKNNISKIRIDKTKKEIEDKKLNYNGLSDKIIENKLLLSYLDKHDGGIDDVLIEDYENKIHVKDSQIKFKNSQIIGVNSKLDVKDLEIKNIESKLANSEHEVNSLQNKLQSANKEIGFLKNELAESKSIAKSKEADYKFKIKELNSIKDDLAKQEEYMTYQLSTANKELTRLRDVDAEMKSTKKQLHDLKKSNTFQSNKLSTKEYCISCYKDEISNNKLEIDYFKNGSIIKKILSPLSYLYLILKSKPNELSINLKLFKALKNSKCFDIGYYLNNHQDIQNSKWVKYFSPELHYVCNGFRENRKFNKKYFNRNSKEELLNYLLICESLE